MDWVDLLERFGIPLVVAGLFWIYIQKQQKYITEELSKELRESFVRLEGIIITLIDQQKRIQIEQKGLERSFKALVEIIASLTGNGLKNKIMRIQDKVDE
tara:strand:- start:8001 stop:8300 length:300 start_codon:yes stop_codon:yes gene_type:complete